MEDRGALLTDHHVQRPGDHAVAVPVGVAEHDLGGVADGPALHPSPGPGINDPPVCEGVEGDRRGPRNAALPVLRPGSLHKSLWRPPDADQLEAGTRATGGRLPGSKGGIWVVALPALPEGALVGGVLDEYLRGLSVTRGQRCANC